VACTLQYRGRVDVEKFSAWVYASDELLMDYGVIPDARPPARIPWRRRLRYRIYGKREDLARRAFRRIAGYDVPEGG